MRRFSHHERHSFDDGSDLELQWEVDADPASILALDAEPASGVRMLECERNTLRLSVPHAHEHRVAAWRHVTASDELHNCRHLSGEDLYRRVLGILSVTPPEPPRKGAEGVWRQGAIVTFSTKELASHSEVVPNCRFFFAFNPVEARDPDAADRVAAARVVDTVPATPGRRLGFSSGQPTFESSLTPVVAADKGNSMINFRVPRQFSHITWNWDYVANTTKNPQFKYTFPGGVGYMRLYKPYLKAHLNVSINFSSRFQDGMMSAPQVNVQADVKGYAHFNADVATAVSFNTDSSATVLDNILDHLPHIPHFVDMPSTESFLSPLKFFIGGMPMSLKPGFSCKMKAYHLGQLKGSLRVGLATRLLLQGTIGFDTDTGVETQFTAKSLDVHFTPPNWMIYTQKFELGMMLEPDLWIGGNFGEMKDLKVGIGLRPYLNVSILQQTAEDMVDVAELVVYPFRMIGLPTGRSYAVEVRAFGVSRRTSSQLSIGVTNFADSVEGFQSGLVSRQDLNNTPIELSILEGGTEVARGQVLCEMVYEGMCHPSPAMVPMTAEGSNSTLAVVQMSSFWEPNSMAALKKKVKGIALKFPMVTLTPVSAALLDAPGMLDSARVVLKHAGLSYSVPVSKTGLNSTMLLESLIMYELGPVFIDSWASTTRPGAPDVLAPVVQFWVDGNLTMEGTLPPVSWDTSGSLASMNTMASSFGQFSSSVATVPVTAAFYAPGDKSKTATLGTCKVEFSVFQASKSAFFVSPAQAEKLVAGKAYKFVWAVAGGKPNEEQTFYISVKTLAASGGLEEVNWLRTVHAKCSLDSGLLLGRYIGDDAELCKFEFEAEVPRMLAGHYGYVILNWMDEQVNPYEMMSTAVEFVNDGGRRLDPANNKVWGPKVKAKLHNLAAHCNTQPLKYNIGVGMNLVEHMKHIMIPVGVPMMGSSKPKATDWSSNPVPVFQSRNNNTRLSDILPKSLCDNGICEGVMPGCQRTPVSPVSISQIEFKLSRSFRWKKHVGPRIRHIIAYALSLAPSSLTIGGHELEQEERHFYGSTTTATSITAATLAATAATTESTRTTAAAITTTTATTATTTTAAMAATTPKQTTAAATTPATAATTAEAAAMPTTSSAGTTATNADATTTTAAATAAMASTTLAPATKATTSTTTAAIITTDAIATTATTGTRAVVVTTTVVAPSASLAATRTSAGSTTAAAAVAAARGATGGTRATVATTVTTATTATAATAAPTGTTGAAATLAAAASSRTTTMPPTTVPVLSAAGVAARGVPSTLAPARHEEATVPSRTHAVTTHASIASTAGVVADPGAAGSATGVSGPARPGGAHHSDREAETSAVSGNGTVAGTGTPLVDLNSSSRPAVFSARAQVGDDLDARGLQLRPGYAQASEADVGVGSVTLDSVAEAAEDPRGDEKKTHHGIFEWVRPFEGAERRLEAAEARDAGLWEVETPEDDEEAGSWEDTHEFDTFLVQINEPLQVALTENILHMLFQQGAFHGLVDGREAERGPVFIKGFGLPTHPTQESDGSTEALAGFSMEPSAAGAAEALFDDAHRKSQVFGGATYSSTAVPAAVSAAFLSAVLFLASAGIHRRRTRWFSPLRTPDCRTPRCGSPVAALLPREDIVEDGCLLGDHV